MEKLGGGRLRKLRQMLSVFVILLASAAGAEEAYGRGPILTITAAGKVLELDRARLSELDWTTVETSTIWTLGLLRFEGVELATLAEALDLKGSGFRVRALNEYEAMIPAEDAVKGGALLALRRDGQDLTTRDRGPVWLIYPYDSVDAYQRDQYYTRSVWQVIEIEVLP